jgi:hypothetical protein
MVWPLRSDPSGLAWAEGASSEVMAPVVAGSRAVVPHSPRSGRGRPAIERELWQDPIIKVTWPQSGSGDEAFSNQSPPRQGQRLRLGLLLVSPCRLSQFGLPRYSIRCYSWSHE